MEVRLITASLSISFSKINGNEATFEAEFERLSILEKDPIGQWFKKQKAKGELDKTNEPIVMLLVELHRKVEDLTKIITGDTFKPVTLDNDAIVNAIGYEYFKIDADNLEQGAYYGRISLPMFPERMVALYFEVQEDGLAKISKMHQQDHGDWDSYVIAKERQHIQDARDMSARGEESC